MQNMFSPKRSLSLGLVIITMRLALNIKIWGSCIEMEETQNTVSKMASMTSQTCQLFSDKKEKHLLVSRLKDMIMQIE